MNVLVTGGAGYIGSHCLVELIEAGLTPFVLDNLCNSSDVALQRVQQITGTSVEWVQGDIRVAADLDRAFELAQPDAVLHLAGLKAVGESVSQPLAYYDNNLVGTIRLLEAMQRHDCNGLVFSSSATVYGDPSTLPIDEQSPTGATTNPYGTTKYQIERLLADWCVANPNVKTVCLRYFNPVGAHISGLIGEDPKGVPNNLMPYVQQVAAGQREQLSVFGDDYDTIDGTGVRDYIHVVDLAKGHLAALNAMDAMQPGWDAVNLGTGIGVSVLQIVKAFEAASGVAVPFRIAPRRPGDIASCYAAPAKARAVLAGSKTGPEGHVPRRLALAKPESFGVPCRLNFDGKSPS